VNGVKLFPGISCTLTNGDLVTMGTTLDAATGGAHLPTKLELHFFHTPSFASNDRSHPPALPARYSFHASSDSEEEGDAVKPGFKTWRPFPPIKVPDEAPLPDVIDLTSDGVWEPKPVEPKVEKDEKDEVECIVLSDGESEVDDGEIYYSRPVELVDVMWDDEESEGESGEEEQEEEAPVVEAEPIVVVPDTQFPETEPPKVHPLHNRFSGGGY
jgi:hypothetical protein